jgi:hypothetical protein
MTGPYILGAGITTRAALLSHTHGSPGWTLLLAACALLFLAAVVHHWRTRVQLRAVLVRLERAARIDHPRITDADWDDLALTCCLRGWETRDREHDPDTCTRKDHHA